MQVEESSTHSSQILFLFVCLFDFLNAFFLTLSCGDDELTKITTKVSRVLPFLSLRIL